MLYSEYSSEYFGKDWGIHISKNYPQNHPNPYTITIIITMWAVIHFWGKCVPKKIEKHC